MLALLVRHAVAGDRRKWSGDDRLRPLDRRGRRQASALPEALSGFPVSRILTSPAARCIGTVEPLAMDSVLTRPYSPWRGKILSWISPTCRRAYSSAQRRVSSGNGLLCIR